MRECRFEITPMRAADVADVLEIERQSKSSPWPEKLFLEELERDWAYIDLARVHSATAGSIVVAFCNYWLVHDEVHLLNLATHQAWRRRGIANTLMDHLLGFAGHHHCRYVTLEVRSSNHPAQHLYRAHGFKAVGVRPRYYAEDGEDAVVMTLDTTCARHRGLRGSS